MIVVVVVMLLAALTVMLRAGVEVGRWLLAGEDPIGWLLLFLVAVSIVLMSTAAALLIAPHLNRRS